MIIFHTNWVSSSYEITVFDHQDEPDGWGNSDSGYQNGDGNGHSEEGWLNGGGMPNVMTNML